MSLHTTPNLSSEPQGCGPLLTGARDAPVPLRQQVLEYVRAHGRAARSDISRALNISPGSATTITADLIAAGILQEVQETTRGPARGRPPVALEIVPDAGLVIGIKLAISNHTAVLADFAGNVVADVNLVSSPNAKNLTQLLNEIEMLIGKLIDKSRASLDQVQAVGIGLPGIIDHATEQILWSSLLINRNEDLGIAFANRFKMPLYLENDANMLTLAEQWFGVGRALGNFAVVTVEDGVGMGLVLNNELYRGTRGMGLELGHMKVHLDGALCRCGQRGCLEAYLADYALVREAATALGQSTDDPQSSGQMLDALFAKAKDGHKSAQTIFKRAGRYLSVGLSNVVQLFDPSLIILSGARMQYDYLYADEVMAEMQNLTLSEGHGPCEVEIHRWGDLVWARGATALALSMVTEKIVAKDSVPA